MTKALTACTSKEDTELHFDKFFLRHLVVKTVVLFLCFFLFSSL